mmetsp:Transcript_5994/g.25079  ORF Transcript_5994/g.25079 Transcript_5994/m.25079 type:complete len:804 (+) Transcript_5994:438-2849(+)
MHVASRVRRVDGRVDAGRTVFGLHGGPASRRDEHARAPGAVARGAPRGRGRADDRRVPAPRRRRLGGAAGLGIFWPGGELVDDPRRRHQPAPALRHAHAQHPQSPRLQRRHPDPALQADRRRATRQSPRSRARRRSRRRRRTRRRRWRRRRRQGGPGSARRGDQGGGTIWHRAASRGSTRRPSPRQSSPRGDDQDGRDGVWDGVLLSPSHVPVPRRRGVAARLRPDGGPRADRARADGGDAHFGGQALRLRRPLEGHRGLGGRPHAGRARRADDARARQNHRAVGGRRQTAHRDVAIHGRLVVFVPTQAALRSSLRRSALQRRRGRDRRGDRGGAPRGGVRRIVSSPRRAPLHSRSARHVQGHGRRTRRRDAHGPLREHPVDELELGPLEAAAEPEPAQHRLARRVAHDGSPVDGLRERRVHGVFGARAPRAFVVRPQHLRPHVQGPREHGDGARAGRRHRGRGVLVALAPRVSQEIDGLRRAPARQGHVLGALGPRPRREDVDPRDPDGQERLLSGARPSRARVPPAHRLRPRDGAHRALVLGSHRQARVGRAHHGGQVDARLRRGTRRLRGRRRRGAERRVRPAPGVPRRRRRATLRAGPPRRRTHRPGRQGERVQRPAQARAPRRRQGPDDPGDPRAVHGARAAARAQGAAHQGARGEEGRGQGSGERAAAHLPRVGADEQQQHAPALLVGDPLAGAVAEGLRPRRQRHAPQRLALGARAPQSLGAGRHGHDQVEHARLAVGPPNARRRAPCWGRPREPPRQLGGLVVVGLGGRRRAAGASPPPRREDHPLTLRRPVSCE